MENHYHSDLEELRRKAQMNKLAREHTSDVESDDVLIVMHRREIDLVLEVMYSILESNESVDKKRIALYLIKHMEG